MIDPYTGKPHVPLGDRSRRRCCPRSLFARVAGSAQPSHYRRFSLSLNREETPVPFVEGDDATETLLFHRADEPLGIRVEIGTLRRETDRLDTPAL